MSAKKWIILIIFILIMIPLGIFIWFIKGVTAVNMGAGQSIPDSPDIGTTIRIAPYGNFVYYPQGYTSHNHPFLKPLQFADKDLDKKYAPIKVDPVSDYLNATVTEVIGSVSGSHCILTSENNPEFKFAVKCGELGSINIFSKSYKIADEYLQKNHKIFVKFDAKELKKISNRIELNELMRMRSFDSDYSSPMQLCPAFYKDSKKTLPPISQMCP